MILFPNAKINLGLNVIARRPDGYHELETIFYPTRWHDILEVVPREGGEPGEAVLTTTGRPILCPAEKNLVMKALAAFRKATGSTRPYSIHLHKIIPDGAGLGGGSADAAFTLIALNRLEGEPLTEIQLADLAGTIGADCSFFIYNTPMFATGIGTTLTPQQLTLPDSYLAIVKPPEGVSTAEAYAGITPAVPTMKLQEVVVHPVTEWQQLMINDFETTVFVAHPRLAMIKAQLIDQGALYASMSGSGSAIFALFPGCEEPDDLNDNMADESLARKLKALFADCDIHVEKISAAESCKK